MEIDDHFDPVDFYSNDPLIDQAPNLSLTTAANTVSTENISHHSNNDDNRSDEREGKLRRSGRPKPAAESLISSPPAIKFYESTVIRKANKPASSTRLSNLRSKRTSGSAEGSPVASSKVLKLRLSSTESNETTTTTSISKENSLEMTPKRNNLRVVKLMMPDITEDDQQSAAPRRSQPTSPVKPTAAASNVKILPLLAPKPPSIPDKQQQQQTETIKVKEFKLKERKPAKTKSEKREKGEDGVKSEKINLNTKSELSDDVKIKKRRKSTDSDKMTVKDELSTVKIVTSVNPEQSSLPRPHIINEDVCSSCGGLGNFICCDACPRSFHFTCAEPPLDPQNLPEDDWYCNECRHQHTSNEQDSGDIWGLMIGKAKRMNPKCFVMPRRFRYQPKEEDLIKLQTGQLLTATTPVTHVTSVTPLTSVTNSLSSPAAILINQAIKIDHCHCEILAPNISAAKSSTGYCHCCGRFGLTKGGLNKTEELPNLPGDPRYHRPMVSCSICPLYWHLDCLDPPLVNFPPASVNWTCPIHFTDEQCIALDLAEALVQSTTLLPESAVKLQFMRKAERIREQTGNEMIGSEDEFEKMYGVTDCINVPENIKSTYQ